MGEVVIEELAYEMYAARRFIRSTWNKGEVTTSEFALVCIAIAQYLALLYADITRFKLKRDEKRYEAFPAKMVLLLPSCNQQIAQTVTLMRNAFCHHLGTKQCLDYLKKREMYTSRLNSFIDDVIFNDKLLQKDTLDKINILCATRAK